MKKNNRCFFLKVNRRQPENMKCIKKWIDICNTIDCQFYIVCDNNQLRKEIKKHFKVNNFLKSYKHELKKITCNLYTGDWKRATYAHVYPFYFCNQKNIKCHWDIDADDLMLCLDNEKIIDMIFKIEEMAQSKNVDAYSLDIWHSRTYNKHWSLGVVYINNNNKIYENIILNQNKNWIDTLENIDESYNLDWFLTYLNNQKKVNLKTFYIENAMLIHWGNFLLNPIYSGIIEWKHSKVYFPVLERLILYQQEPILITDMDAIDLKVMKGECINYLQHEISDIYNLSDKRRKLYKIMN